MLLLSNLEFEFEDNLFAFSPFFRNHHHQFKVIYYSMLAWVRLFITIVFLQFSLSCARLRVTPSSRKSEAITYPQVF